nr:polysaccharide pyruvyl transferase family protein [Planctomonas sp. JC2975]
MFGVGNFGNEATLTALLMRARESRIVPVVVCPAPDRVRADYSVETVSLGDPVTTNKRTVIGLLRLVANRAGVLRNALAIARSVDAVAIAGTGPWEAFAFGSFDIPYEMWCLMVAARLTRRPFLVLDVGAERSPRPIARWFIRQTARFASYLSFRDSFSVSEMVADGAGFITQDSVVCDLAFGLPGVEPTTRFPRSVVVGVMEYSGRVGDRSRGSETLDSYRDRCSKLLRNLSVRGYEITLVGGQDRDVEFAFELKSTMRAEGVSVAVAPVRRYDELIRVMSTAQVVVASRYHTLIMALLARTPIVSIGYAGKHAELFDLVGLDAMHRDIDSFDTDEVVGLVDESVINCRRLSISVGDAVSVMQDRLDAQWVEVSSRISAKRLNLRRVGSQP